MITASQARINAETVNGNAHDAQREKIYRAITNASKSGLFLITENLIRGSESFIEELKELGYKVTLLPYNADIVSIQWKD